MQVFVKTLSGKTQTIEAEASDTIWDVKRKVHAIEGAPLDMLRLIFEGRQLRDDMTVADSRIERDKTLHVNLRLLNCASCESRRWKLTAAEGTGI